MGTARPRVPEAIAPTSNSEESMKTGQMNPPETSVPIQFLRGRSLAQLLEAVRDEIGAGREGDWAIGSVTVAIVSVLAA